METDRQKCEKENAKMEQVAQSFQTAMKGIGTDENRIIREVIAYNNRQRQLIKSKYLVITGNVRHCYFIIFSFFLILKFRNWLMI